MALAGPVLWLVAFEAGYVLAMGCDRFVGLVHLVVGASAVASGAAAWTAWRIVRGADGEWPSGPGRWLGAAAIGLNLWSAITIAAMEFPIVAIRPCVP
jgi:hypothetical protein